MTPLARSAGRAYSRSQVNWWFRTGALLMAIHLVALARTARTRWEPAGLIAGSLLTASGFVLPGAAAFFAGLLILIVTLAVSSRRNRLP